jgi:hypothetical protein
MKAARVAVVLLAVVAVACNAGPAPVWKTFKGAWFDVKYPPSFKVVPRQASSSQAGKNQYDAVSFISPDGKCEFYVFSPQWNGSPNWIKLLTGEKMTSKSTQSIKGGISVAFVGIRGPGGKYFRDYADTLNKTLNTRKVFGIKYTSKSVYNAYRPQYLKFKSSLTQYAD